MSASDIILKLSNIESYYGPIMAIRGISLEVPRGQIEKFDHLLDPAAMGFFGGAHARQEQQFLPELRGGVTVATDQQIAQHGRILEQFDVLERAGDTELRDAECGLVRDVLILEIDPARGRAVDPRNQVEDRALAGPVGTDDRQYFALLDGEADGVDGFQPTEMQGQVFGAEIAHRFRSDFT